MEQWIPRGTKLNNETLIRTIQSTGIAWQLYSTNVNKFALIVKKELLDQWINSFSVPSGIFRSVDEAGQLYYYISTGDYMVSSLNKGPFPDSLIQIEAFALSMSTTLRLYPNTCLEGGVYIEEFSFVLPDIESSGVADNEMIYTRWLTGGVEGIGNSFYKLARFVSWLSSDDLREVTMATGLSFDYEENESDVQTEIKMDANEGKSPQTTIPTPNGHFSLIGRPELETFFNDNIIDIVENIDKYSRVGISFPGATILHGAPGCGKTYAIDRLTEYLGWKRYDIDSTSIASSYIHETSKKIANVFNDAIKNAPSILVIDEMEAFLSDRAMSGAGSTHHVEEVAEFLRRIPEAISKGVLIFAMTNLIDTIDPAILRRGRFDHVIEVKMPTKEEIAALLKFKFQTLPVAEDVSIDVIAEKLESHPMSDVDFVLREAGRFSVKGGKEYIDCSCFENAMGMLPKKEEKRRIGF